MNELVVFFCKSCAEKIACNDGTKLRRCKACDLEECPAKLTSRTSSVLTCFECIENKSLEER